MADEVSSIGVRLTLNAQNFMAGMTAATEKTDAFIASAKQAATVAGRSGGPSGATRSSAAPKMAAVPVDLTISQGQIRKLRDQIITGIGTIPIKIQPVVSGGHSLEDIVAAQITPTVGTRSGAKYTVQSNVKKNLPTRAGGGPVWPGQDFIVGERGPERVRFGGRGMVTPDYEAVRRRELADARREMERDRQHQRQMAQLRHGGGYARSAGGAAAARAAEEAMIANRAYDTFSRLATHRMATRPEASARSLRWYQRQLPHLNRIADAVGIPREAASAIVAEISSNNPWPNNAIDLMRLFPDSWRRNPSKKLSSPLATGKNRASIGEILGGRGAVGIKKNAFMRALLGDPSGIPADVWMARLSRVALPRDLGADVDIEQVFSAALMSLHGGGAKGGVGWTQNIRQAEIRSIHSAVERVAAELGQEPRGIQALLWDIIRDRSEELGYSKKQKLRRHGGGYVHAARGTRAKKFQIPGHEGMMAEEAPYRAKQAAARKWWENPPLIPEERKFGNLHTDIESELAYFAMGWPTPISAGYEHLSTPPGFFARRGREDENRYRAGKPYTPIMPSRLRYPGSGQGANPMDEYMAHRNAQEQAKHGQLGFGDVPGVEHYFGAPYGTQWNPFNYLEEGHFGIEPPTEIPTPFAMSPKIRARQEAAEKQYAFEQTPAGKRAKAKAERDAAKQTAATAQFFGDLTRVVKVEEGLYTGYRGNAPALVFTDKHFNDYKGGEVVDNPDGSQARIHFDDSVLSSFFVNTTRNPGTARARNPFKDKMSPEWLACYQRIHAEALARANPNDPHFLEAAGISKLPEVPQHEAPTVAAHQAVIESHAKKVAEEAVVPKAVEKVLEAAAESTRMIGPSLFETTPRMPSTTPKTPQEARNALRAMGLITRHGGGYAAEGAYIVNELGPEAFIEQNDMGKLALKRPDIVRRIPGAGDGLRSGMIDKPAWSMFAPRKDGYIVRREDAHAALHAIRAQTGGGEGGIFTPAQLAEQERERARASQMLESLARPRIITPSSGFQSTGPIEAFFRGVRDTDMEAFAKTTAGTAQSFTDINAAIRQMRFPGAGGMPTVSAPSPAAAGRAERAAASIERAAGSAEKTAAGDTTGLEGVAKGAWVAVGRGLQAQEVVANQVRELLQQGAKRKEILTALPHMVRETPAGEGGIEVPSGRTPLVSLAMRAGAVSARHERIRANVPDEIQERLDLLRLQTAGVGQFEATGMPKRVAAVISQALFGGGQQFRQRQAALVSARAAFTTAGRNVIAEEKEVAQREHALKIAENLGASEEELSSIRTELTDHSKTLTKAQEHLAASSNELERAEKAVQPTAGTVVKSFASIVAGTTAYGIAFGLVNEALAPIEAGMTDWVKSLGDQYQNFVPTATKVTSALADQTRQSYGNYQAVLATSAAMAGLSGSMTGFVGSALEASTTAKAGAKAQGDTVDLFRSAMTQLTQGGAPQGLIGGYGGVLGSSLLASQLGGGPGLSEQIYQGLKKGQNAGTDTANALTKAVDFFANPDFRQGLLNQEKQNQGFGPLQAVATGIGTLGDFLTMTPLSPFAQFFGGKAPGLPGAPAPVPQANVAGVFQGRTQVEQEGIRNYLADLTDAASRGAQARGATGARYVETTDPAAIARASKAAMEANDDSAYAMAQLGVVVQDTSGKIVDSGKDLIQFEQDIAKGKTIVSPEVFVQQNLRQLQAQQQATAVETQRALTLEIPGQMREALLQSPILKPGIGFFPGAAAGRPNIARAGVTGAVGGQIGDIFSGVRDANKELTQISEDGYKAQLAEVQQFMPDQLGAFKELNTEADAASSAIAKMSNRMAQLNQQAATAQWDNQIRLARRALGDAIAMQGKAGGERLGYLQREEFLIQRASNRLQLELQQRQITTQIALAQFQAPGETGEERYMRQKEKLAEASIAQRQLGFSWKSFEIDGAVWKENVNRAAEDARRAIGVMQKARNAEAYSIAAQEGIGKQQAILGDRLARINAIVGGAGKNWSNAFSAAISGVGAFAGSVNDAVDEIYSALGYTKTKHGYVKTNDTMGGMSSGRTSTGYYGLKSSGYLGHFAGGATFTVGEAGTETVAILRNPRTHMIGGEGGGGSAAPITININGPVVRKEEDVAYLAKCVAAEVERALSKKGQLLGLRAPAY